jgi:large subunit ribosomal protein L47
VVQPFNHLLQLEESMENLLEVVKERDRAVNLLETGETGEPGKRWAYDVLGQGYWHRMKEHYVPLHYNKVLRDRVALAGKWQYKFKRLYRERMYNKKHAYEKKQEEDKAKLDSAFEEVEYFK